MHLAAGRGEAAALVFDSPQTATKDTYSYRRLHDEVVAFAGALDGLAPTPPAYQPLLEAALSGARHRPRHLVVLQRQEAGRWIPVPGRDLDWHELTARSAWAAPRPVAVPSAHPLYMLFTSGSTSRPKAVTRDTGGYLTALRWAVENVFGVGAGDVFWTDSHPGWVMGHSFTVYGALVTGATAVLYEGSPADTPDPSAFGRIIAEHGVSGAWARLSRLVFVAALPHTPSEKIKRSDLRAWPSTGSGLDVLADIALVPTA
ncbi:AMP-binding protein [Streptomyces sp. NPDC089919]|uniref:AMP-binding protein n=1 Tax=Streptomyces sp. NPDC089919 TaxID=3155188 RepID=UPI0034307195